jgi:hypothetical protein
MRVVVLLSFVAVLLVARAARADLPAPSDPAQRYAFRLSFKTVDGCPGEGALRAEVAAWVGYDPFTPSASDRVTVWFERVDGAFRGAFMLTDAAGTSGVHQEVEASCVALYRTMGIAIGYALTPSDAQTGVVAAPVTVPDVVPVPAPEVVRAPAPVPMAAPAAPTRALELLAGVDGTFTPILMPSAGAGFAPWITFRLREVPLSFELGMRATWSVVPAHFGASAVRSTYFSGVLAPCWHGSLLFGCAKLEVGAMNLSTDPSAFIPAAPNPLTIVAGGRFGLQRAFAERFAVRSFLEIAGVPQGPRTLSQNMQSLWSAPGYSITFGLGFATQLW